MFVGGAGFAGVCQPLFLQTKKQLWHFPISAMHVLISYTNKTITICRNASWKSDGLSEPQLAITVAHLTELRGN